MGLEVVTGVSRKGVVQGESSWFSVRLGLWIGFRGEGHEVERTMIECPTRNILFEYLELSWRQARHIIYCKDSETQQRRKYHKLSMSGERSANFLRSRSRVCSGQSEHLNPDNFARPHGRDEQSVEDNS